MYFFTCAEAAHLQYFKYELGEKEEKNCWEVTASLLVRRGLLFLFNIKIVKISTQQPLGQSEINAVQLNIALPHFSLPKYTFCHL